MAADSIDFDGILKSMYQLGPTEEERRRAANLSMLKMGLGILGANQPSPTPRNTLGVLAAGSAPGVDAYQQSLDKQVSDRRGSAIAALTTGKLVSELRSQNRRDKAFDDLGGLTPEQKADPKFLYDQALKHSAAGNKELASTFLSMANHAATLTNRRDPSQMERALDVIRKYHAKDSMKPGSLTADEQSDLHNNIAIVGQVRQALDPATQRLETYQPLTLPDIYQPMLDRYSVKRGKPGDVFPQNPDGVGRRAIDQGSEKELQGFNDANKQLADLWTDFKPTYGGWLLDPVAQGALAAGRRLAPDTLKAIGKPDLNNQAEWWQRYYNWANDVRAAKFGLTLTGNELTAFERSTPKPSDSPEAIQRAVEAQMAQLNNKRANRTQGLIAGGYNPEQTRATAGPERTLQPTDEEALKAVQEAAARGETATAHFRQQPAKDYPKPSPAAIKRLQMNPSEKAQFEAIFGPGSSAAHLGGQR